MNPLKTSLPSVLQEPAIPDRRKLTDKDIAALKRSCQDFEAIFIQSMFKSMRKTVPDGGLFTRDTAHEIYQEMLDSEVASKISRNQSMGLADQIYRQIKKNFLPDSEKK
jgi:flagellar protein FlgJ